MQHVKLTRRVIQDAQKDKDHSVFINPLEVVSFVPAWNNDGGTEITLTTDKTIYVQEDAAAINDAFRWAIKN